MFHRKTFVKKRFLSVITTERKNVMQSNIKITSYKRLKNVLRQFRGDSNRKRCESFFTFAKRGQNQRLENALDVFSTFAKKRFLPEFR